MAASHELPDSDMELNNIMRVLGDPKFSFKEYIGTIKPEDEMSKEEKEKRDEEQKIVDDKFKASESTISDIAQKFNTFNKQTLKMINHTPSKILSEMAVRLFVGSRDIPKNVPKAMKLLEIAQKKEKGSMSFKEQKDVEFFEIMLQRMNSEYQNDPSHFWELNSRLKELAEEGHPNAMFVYGSELLLL